MFILIRISDSIKNNGPALFHLKQIRPGTGEGKKNNNDKTNYYMTTKRALIKELAQRMECTDVAAKKFLNSYIDLITEKLSEGEGVSIHYFGKLIPHYQTERPGRNLRTGEECKIRARTSVKFKASEILIQKLNTGK